MKSAGDPAQVKSLIESIKSFKGFRNMAAYNISCLMSHITPPTVGWRENITTAVADGGIESIIDLLRAHPSALDMLKLATEALSGLTTSSANAAIVAKSGGVESALNSMLGLSPDQARTVDGQEAQEAGSVLLVKVAQFNPSAILDSQGGVSAVLEGLIHSQNSTVKAACATVADRVGVSERGQKELLRKGAIQALITAIAPGTENTEDMLKPTFRLLERFAEDPNNVKLMRDLGGVEALVYQLEAHADNEILLRMGGRLLAKVAAGDLEGAIDRLKRGGLSDAAREFTIGLIANLALQPENIDRIIKHGGVRVLIENFDQFNPRTQVAAARALGRLANNKENAAEIIREGGVKVLVKAMLNNPDNLDLITACTQALANIATSSLEAAKAVDSEGGIKAVLDCLTRHPEADVNAVLAMRMLEQLANLGFDTHVLVSYGAVEAILGAMAANIDSADVQRGGFRSLSSIMRNEKRKKGFPKTAAIAILSYRGGCATLVHSIEAHRERSAVVSPALDTFATLISKESTAADHLSKAGAVPAIVSAVFSQMLAAALGSIQAAGTMDGKFESNVRTILAALVSKKEAQARVKTINGEAQSACAGNENAAESLESTLEAVAVYAREPTLAAVMDGAGLSDSLLRGYQAVVASNGLPKHGAVMSANALAIASFARCSGDVLSALSNKGATRVLIEASRKHPKLADATICAMRALRVFGSSAPVRAKLIEEGCVEAVVGAMRSNSENPWVALAALDVMLAIASSDALCGPVVYKGGARQAIKMIMDNASSEVFERPTERALMLMDRVASSKTDADDVRTNLIKQGAVGAVTQAMEAYPWSDNIEAIGARLLSRLLDAAGVEAEIDMMMALVSELKTTKSPEKVLPKLARSMATVGALAISPSNTEIMERKGAAGIIVDALHTISKLPLTREREYARRAGFRALGQIASMQPLPANLGAIELIMAALKAPESKVTLLEKMGAFNCVKSMATIESSAAALVGAGIVSVSVGLLKEHAHDEAFVTAGFGALASIAQHQSGANECTSAGLVRLTMNSMRNLGDSCGPHFAEEAMTLLANLALVERNIAEMMDGNVVDLVNAAIDHHCSDPSNPEPGVLTAAVTLLQRLAVNEENIKLIVGKGALDKVIATANSTVAYLSDPECAEALLFLIESCALVKETHESLLKAGAVEAVMSAMSLNPTNDAVVMTGSKALQALLGGNSDSVKVLLNEINKLSSHLKKKPADVATQMSLLHSLRNLGNLMLVEGVVKAKAAGEVAKTAVHTTNIVERAMVPGPAKSDLLTSTMQILGRAALIAGANINSDKAIKSVLAVIRANPSDDKLLESAMYALGNLVNSPDAVRALVANGGIELLEKTINESAENERLRDAAVKALEKLRNAAAAGAGELASDPAGANALAEVIKAHSNDPAALRDLLREIAAGPTGLHDLLAILGSDGFKTASPETRTALLRALREQLERSGNELAVTDASDMAGLLASLDESTDGLTKQEKEAVLERQKEALDLLALLSGASAGAFAGADGVRKLLDLMNKYPENVDVSRAVLRALNRLADDKGVVDRLVEANAAAAIAAAMRQHYNDEDLQVEAMSLLNKMAAIKGFSRAGMDAETMRLINRIVDQFRDNDAIQRDGGKLLDGLSTIFKEDGADMIGSRLDASILKLKGADHIQMLYDDQGRPYYYNTETGETSWDMPPELADSLAALQALAKLTAAHKDNIHEVDPNALAGAIAHFRAHMNEPARLTDLTRALGVLATNEANRDAIARAGGLEAIIQALNGEHVDPEFLAAAIHLLNQFARNDYFKDQIAQLGGIEALIIIMLKFIEHLEVVEKCMSTLANLAYNSRKNMAEIMKYNGPDAVQKCMARYPREPELLNFAMILLSNLMFGSDENKLVIGRKCGNEIVGVTRNHFKDTKLFKGALRALGNLSYCDENILWIVQNGATKCIVAGMVANEEDLETQQIAIEVIGNFASYNEDDPETRRRIERGEQTSVYDIILLEGGAKRILDTVRKTEEPTLMMSGLEALGNLANNIVITEKLIKMGIVGIIFKAMLKYDWDEDLLDRAVRLVAILTYSQDGVRAIREHNGVQIILNAMESHEDQPEFLANAAAALKNIAADEQLRDEIGTLGGVQSCISLMERNMASMPFLLEVITLFVRLTRSEELSMSIAQKGMNIILEAIGAYKNDINFLVPVFTLIGHLAFAPENLKIIVQYGGIDLIIDSILSHPESKNLVIRCIQTLDNIAMHSSEQSKIVIQAGGEATIKEVITAYKSDKEVVQVGRSALLSMQPQVERRRAKPKYAFANERTSTVRHSTEDPLREYRNLLKTGVVLTHWSNSGPVSRHFYVKADFRQLAWRDPKKSARSEHTINIRDVRNVRSGLHDGHRRGRRQAKQDLAFTIIARATSIDLEARTTVDRERWVEALAALINTYKNEPQWLK